MTQETRANYIDSIILLTSYVFVVFFSFIFPSFADVAGSLSSATDTFILWIRAALALIIIGCLFSALKGNVIAGITIFVCAAGMVTARELASLIN